MIRVINWNICYSGDITNKLKLLKSVINEGNAPCIIALEEVVERDYLEISKDTLFSNNVYSLTKRKPGIFDGKNRGLGCLVIFIGDFTVKGYSLIERAPFPERTIIANVTHNNMDVEFICFHSLTGVDYKKAKSAQFAALAEHLHNKREERVILCCDLNEPNIDHIDLDKIEFFSQNKDKGKSASLILRPNGVHNLEDAFRVYLKKNFTASEDEKKSLEDHSNEDDQPLAVSHKVSKKFNKRYDYIMISPHWEVKDITYMYDEAVEHGSDHALVFADIKIEYPIII